MKTFALDSKGDLLIREGEFVVIEEAEDIKQSLSLILSTNKGEWFLDREMGLEFSALLDKPTDARIRAAVIEAISQEPRVQSIDHIEINQDRQKRVVYIHFKVTTSTNEQVESEVSVNA
ncbi:DUF2634 domain-containing protein [Halobacillus sp. SY10]|uniref:contractile injection system sheath initiator n=1 Tax=Halobacillus sp. SY10 TaxID=3381356 RepID=UPI00387A3D70